jgi:hypothetical protein
VHWHVQLSGFSSGRVGTHKIALLNRLLWDGAHLGCAVVRVAAGDWLRSSALTVASQKSTTSCQHCKQCVIYHFQIGEAHMQVMLQSSAGRLKFSLLREQGTCPDHWVSPLQTEPNWLLCPRRRTEFETGSPRACHIEQTYISCFISEN